MIQPLPRRFFLKSGAGLIFLPFLEAMLHPLKSLASTAPLKNFVIMFAPYGMLMHDDLNIYKVNKNWEKFYIPDYTLGPLQTLSSYYATYRGLYNAAGEKAEELLKRDFPHTIEATGFFTGSHKDQIKQSIDQIVCEKLNLQHPLERINILSPCYDNDSYFFNSSFKDGRPNARFSDPERLYRTLFNTQEEIKKDRSLLDHFMAEIKSLKRKVNSRDKSVLDHHLQGIRDTERLIASTVTQRRLVASAPSQEIFFNLSDNYDKATQALLKLVGLAMVSGVTRVATVHLGGGNDPKIRYNFLKIPNQKNINIDIHDLTHYRNLNGPSEFFDQFREVNKYHINHLAQFMNQLNKEKVGNGTSLLDNTVGIYGGGMSQCHFHNYKNIPLIRFGKIPKQISGGSLSYNMKEGGESYNDFVYSLLQKELNIDVGRIGKLKNKVLPLS